MEGVHVRRVAVSGDGFTMRLELEGRNVAFRSDRVVFAVDVFGVVECELARRDRDFSVTWNTCCCGDITLTSRSVGALVWPAMAGVAKNAAASTEQEAGRGRMMAVPQNLSVQYRPRYRGASGGKNPSPEARNLDYTYQREKQTKKL